MHAMTAYESYDSIAVKWRLYSPHTVLKLLRGGKSPYSTLPCNPNRAAYYRNFRTIERQERFAGERSLKVRRGILWLIGNRLGAEEMHLWLAIWRRQPIF